LSLAALGTESEEMDAMVAYFEFISKDFESEKDISWRMENEMEEVPEPDVTNGSELFVEKIVSPAMQQMDPERVFPLGRRYGVKAHSTKRLE